MKSSVAKFLIIIFVGILGLDIWTKYLIKSNVAYGSGFVVIDGFFNIVHALNPGAAFGALRNMNDSYRQIFFVVVTIIAIILVISMLWRERKPVPSIGYTLIIAGACGNLIDRATTGHVVDFLDFYIGKYHWPAFNVADSAITVGIAIILIEGIFFSTNKKHR